MSSMAQGCFFTIVLFNNTSTAVVLNLVYIKKILKEEEKLFHLLLACRCDSGNELERKAALSNIPVH